MTKATAATKAALEQAARQLPADDGADFVDARRGFLGSIPDGEIKRSSGAVVWSQRDYRFLDDPVPPATVHPSLWRQARLNCVHGLFEVVPGIYQVRGLDIANMTLIEGRDGLIILDTLSCPDTAAAALQLYRDHRDPEARGKVHTVLYSHCHVDHFGGVAGIVTQAQVAAGEVRIVAPSGFLQHAVSENVIAGMPMARRSQFQFGHTLPKGSDVQVDAGLGKSLPLSPPSLIAPTITIDAPFETHEFDGIEIIFQLAPDTEAPAEMHFYFPKFRALNMAENATHLLHNLLPLRGAQVRDALGWSKYLNEAHHRFGDDTDVLMAQHHWPTWGNSKIKEFLSVQRDLYRYIHDQTVRLMSHGLKPAEIAEELRLPPALANCWHARDYYGSVSHNAKAVYQRYLSWYDAHPANLNPLPQVAAARKTIDYMGGIEVALKRAEADFDAGEYRWVAEVMKHAVYAYPDHTGARELAGRTMEQLAFQAESATWRNAYLLAAHEYRQGSPQPQSRPPTGGLTSALTSEMLFDSLAVRLNATKARDAAFTMNWHFTDSNENWLVEISNCVLHAIRKVESLACDVSLSLDRSTLQAIMTQQLAVKDAIGAGHLAMSGRTELFGQFLLMLDRFSMAFPVVDAAKLPS